MNWPEFSHEAMAARFAIAIADQPADYARQAAGAAFRELDRLEGELSRFVESSDIARANRLARGETIAIGDDTLACLLLAAEVCVTTRRAFDPAYASAGDGDAVPFTLDPEAHTLTSRTPRLLLDLGAIGKGYALDRLAETLRDWGATSALLDAGGSTVLALEPPPGTGGWAVGLGDGPQRRTRLLAHAALSASGVAVKGAHLLDPRTGAPAARTTRVWASAPSAALADALSTAFFVLADPEIEAFCAAHPEVGAALTGPSGELRLHGALAA